MFHYHIGLALWTDLAGASSGAAPSPRWGHGFASAGDQLFVFGGIFKGDP